MFEKWKQAASPAKKGLILNYLEETSFQKVGGAHNIFSDAQFLSTEPSPET